MKPKCQVCGEYVMRVRTFLKANWDRRYHKYDATVVSMCDACAAKRDTEMYHDEIKFI
jgi:hypothetical protein